MSSMKEWYYLWFSFELFYEALYTFWGREGGVGGRWGAREREKGLRRKVLESSNSSATPLAKRRALLAKAVQSLTVWQAPLQVYTCFVSYP